MSFQQFSNFRSFIFGVLLLNLQASSILERNSLLMLISFLIVCIIPRKPPSFKILRLFSVSFKKYPSQFVTFCRYSSKGQKIKPINKSTYILWYDSHIVLYANFYGAHCAPLHSSISISATKTKIGASNGSRTRDLVLTKDALCQLSYGSELSA